MLFKVSFFKNNFCLRLYPRRLMIVLVEAHLTILLIITHLTIRQISTHLTMRLIITHVISIFLLQSNNLERKSPDSLYYNRPYNILIYRKLLHTQTYSTGTGKHLVSCVWTCRGTMRRNRQTPAVNRGGAAKPQLRTVVEPRMGGRLQGPRPF